ncbi:MAG: HAMP domain-containing sensor histidine kinase [Chlorobiales bacterium]
MAKHTSTRLLSRFSLRVRFFALSSLLLFASIAVVYAFVRPQYDKVLLDERITIVSEQQNYAITSADRDLMNWLGITKYLATLFSARPEHFELALKDQIETHSDLIRISVISLQTGDELEAQNSQFPNRVYPISHGDWQASRVDSAISVAFYRDSSLTVCAFRLPTSLYAKPYLLTCYFNVTSLFDNLLSIPFGNEVQTALFLQHHDTLLPLASSANYHSFPDLRVSLLSETRTIEQAKTAYLMMSAPFRTAPLYFFLFIPRDVILEPATRLTLFSLSFSSIALIVLFVVGWVASAQVTKPVQTLVDAVKPMQSLDFSKPIPSSPLPELRTLSLTIDSMRETLDRYQKLNVEKIIFEEWKNKLLMTYSEDLIGIAGGDDRFTFQNKRFAELCKELGFQTAPTREQFFHHRLLKVIKKSKTTEQIATFEMERHQSEIELTFKDSTESYRVQTVALYSSEKILIGSFIILHDLTQERELEKIKAETMNIIVHELRSPLNSVIGFSDLLLQPTDFDEASKKEFITMIHNSGNRLLKLVNRFLDVMRLESGRQEIVRVNVNLTFIVQYLIDSLSAQATQKSIRFAFKCDESIPTIQASEELMMEAIQNLMTNAIKYGGPNRTIDLELHADEHQVIFSITDYGYGIPPEAQEKLFTKFYRVPHPNANKEIGTGLGLAYVKEIVTRHGGTISFESNPNIGCRFTISLPIKATTPTELHSVTM